MKPVAWIVALALAALLGIAWDFDHGAELEASHQEEAAKASREWVIQQVCGNNAAGEWLDDKTLQCYTHRGQKTIVAEVPR